MTDFQTLASEIEDLKDLVRSLGDRFDAAAIPAAIAEIRKDVTELDNWTGLSEGKRTGRTSLARSRDNTEGILVATRVLNLVTGTIVAAAAALTLFLALGNRL